MSNVSRRDALKTGLFVAGGVLVGESVTQLVAGTARADAAPLAAGAPDDRPADSPAQRQRLLLDFDWRFHPGHAADPAQ
ncbi:MAG: hypothetical protein KGJ70_08445, partial [Gemmatimonadota bacterium]|nr:hypothetical protein [Gemmatimonadota bacterium]